MLKRLSFRTFFLLLMAGGILFGIFYQRYWIRSEVGGITTLTNDKELFIFVEVIHYRFSCGYLKEWVIMAGFPVAPPSSVREDQVVWHYQNGHLERFEMKDFPTTGVYVPFEGQLYKLIGGNTLPLPIWRWTGTTFERLPDKEAGELRARMDSSFRYASDQLTAEGWQQNEYAGAFQEQEKSYQFNLSGHSVNLLVRKAGESATQTRNVFLTGSGLPASGETLARIDSQWKQVDKSEYNALTGEFTNREN